MAADYSQIEVRLLAHFSQDPILIRHLSLPGSDLFQEVASRWASLGLGFAQDPKTLNPQSTAPNLEGKTPLSGASNSGEMGGEKGDFQASGVGREKAKRLVYGVLYGMGPRALASALGCTFQEASRAKEEFLGQFPQVALWLESTVDKCRESGYSSGLFWVFRGFGALLGPGPLGFKISVLRVQGLRFSSA